MCKRLLFVVILLGGLTHCRTMPVAENVEQVHANEIVAALHAQGISAIASKASGGRGSYDVYVKRRFYAPAVAVISDKELLAPRDSFSDLVAKKGFIPDSRQMEALRLDHAMAVELEEVLGNHPAIASARVVVRLHVGEEQSSPMTSIVLQLRPDETVDEEMVRQIAQRTIPGITPEQITVALHEQRDRAGDSEGNKGVINKDGRVFRVPLEPFLFFWWVASDDYAGLALAVVAFVGVMTLVGVAFGYWFGYFQHSKRFLLDEGVDSKKPMLRSTSQVKNLPEA